MGRISGGPLLQALLRQGCWDQAAQNNIQLAFEKLFWTHKKWQPADPLVFFWLKLSFIQILISFVFWSPKCVLLGGGDPCVLSPGNLSCPATVLLVPLFLPLPDFCSCSFQHWEASASRTQLWADLLSKAVGRGGVRSGQSRQWMLWNEGAGEGWGGKEEGPHFSVSASGVASGSCVALHIFWVLNSSKGSFLLQLQINCHCWYPNRKFTIFCFMLSFCTLFFILFVESLGTVTLGCNIFSLSLVLSTVPF